MASSDVQESLQDSSAGSGQSRKHERTRSILVVTEVALACILLVGAGLLLRSFLNVLDVDLGFEPIHAAAISVSYDDSGGAARRGVILQPVPIHPLVCEALVRWKEQSAYRQPGDWVFASRHSQGKLPYWGQAILQKYLRPAARELGIEKKFGWHTFRHTYSALLRSVGTEFKVMQELLLHSTIRSTLDVYTQAITPAKHSAQAAVMSLVFSAQ